MVDYIRGKKAYTKWDADTENVDIEYHEGPKSSTMVGCLSGTKGKAIKILFLLMLFSLGLVLGYFIRRGIHEKALPLNGVNSVPEKFTYSLENARMLQSEIRAENIKKFLWNVSLKPHVSGSSDGKEVALTIQQFWDQCGLDDVRLEPYNALLSYPSPVSLNTVVVIDDKNVTVANFSAMPAKTELKPYLAYSANGIVTGKLVYANYGRREDFEKLSGLNVSMERAIVIIRLGKIHRGEKVRLAEKNGAAGVILYPDPADYVGNRSVYPEGQGLPADAIVYGSLKSYPGDPETPQLPSIDASYRMPPVGLPTIPAQPISYSDAARLLESLGGPIVPEGWNGSLNLTYRVGPGFSAPNETRLVRLSVENVMERRQIYNVIGVIYGKYELDEYVIVGCHHDTWTTSASDPGSGMALMMEIVQAFGQLRHSTGWVPNRSIVFASWDAEEFGMVGSTEWVEDHAKELINNAVAYINVDSAVTGNRSLRALGSPLLQKALYEVTKQLTYQEEGQPPQRVFDVWQPRNPTNSSIRASLANPKLDILGSGSDFVSFMSGLGISSVHLEFIDDSLETDYPLYHTEYDTYDAISRLVDPSFNASATLAKVVATLALKLADSLILPFSCHDYVTAMEYGFAQIKQQYGDYLAQHGILLDILNKAITHFDRAANVHYTKFSYVNDSKSILLCHEYNHQLIQVERAFILPRGIEDSPTYRHAIFGPHPYNLYEGVTFPGIVDSVLRAQFAGSTPASIDAIKVQIDQVVHAIRSAGNMLITTVVTRVTNDAFL